jgi:hypothetical protein
VWSVGRQCGRQGGGGIWVAARTAARRRGWHMDAIRADRASARGWVSAEEHGLDETMFFCSLALGHLQCRRLERGARNFFLAY